MNRIKNIVSASFIVLFLLHNSYTFAVGLETQEVQYKIQHTFRDYDSIILFNRSAWKLDDYYWGIGYKNQAAYKLICRFRFTNKDGVHTKLAIKRIKELRFRMDDSLLFNINFNRIRNLSIDSLNDISGTNRRISGGDNYYILSIFQGIFNYKYSYMPKSHQKLSPNQDRAYYLQMIYTFKEIFNLDFIMG